MEQLYRQAESSDDSKLMVAEWTQDMHKCRYLHNVADHKIVDQTNVRDSRQRRRLAEGSRLSRKAQILREEIKTLVEISASTCFYEN